MLPKVTHSDPRVTFNDPKMIYSDPKVTYSDPKVTYSDPTHLPLPPPTSPGHIFVAHCKWPADCHLAHCTVYYLSFYLLLPTPTHNAIKRY